MESVIDGVTSRFETINPAELGTWEETVRKRGSSVLEYELYLNGYLYQRYELDFESGHVYKKLDNTDRVKFG